MKPSDYRWTFLWLCPSHSYGHRYERTQESKTMRRAVVGRTFLPGMHDGSTVMRKGRLNLYRRVAHRAV